MSKFVVHGRPLPLQRHRCVKSTNRMYDPSAAAKRDFLRLCIAKRPPCGALAGPLAVHLKFRMPRPKSHFRTGKFNHVLRADAPTLHTKTPDVDNLAKFVLDALNGTFYVDDAQIVRLSAVKDYASAEECARDHEAARAGSTHVEIEPLSAEMSETSQTSRGGPNAVESLDRELEEWAAGEEEPPALVALDGDDVVAVNRIELN